MPGEVLDAGELQGGVEAVLDVLHGFAGVRSEIAREGAQGSREANSFSRVVFAVALSSSDSGRPIFVRGMRMTLLGESI